MPEDVPVARVSRCHSLSLTPSALYANLPA
jgi:hypothetical protein